MGLALAVTLPRAAIRRRRVMLIHLAEGNRDRSPSTMWHGAALTTRDGFSTTRAGPIATNRSSVGSAIGAVPGTVAGLESPGANTFKDGSALPIWSRPATQLVAHQGLCRFGRARPRRARRIRALLSMNHLANSLPFAEKAFARHPSSRRRYFPEAGGQDGSARRRPYRLNGSSPRRYDAIADGGAAALYTRARSPKSSPRCERPGGA